MTSGPHTRSPVARDLDRTLTGYSQADASGSTPPHPYPTTTQHFVTYPGGGIEMARCDVVTVPTRGERRITSAGSTPGCRLFLPVIHAMAAKTPCPRPWYCADTLVDAYKQLESHRGQLRMLQHLKVARAIFLNFLVAGFGGFTILNGGDPTIIGGLTLTALALLNGIEVSEWLAAKQALKELDIERDDE